MVIHKLQNLPGKFGSLLECRFSGLTLLSLIWWNCIGWKLRSQEMLVKMMASKYFEKHSLLNFVFKFIDFTRELETEIFHPLFHIPVAHKSEGWARVEPKARSSISVCYQGDSEPNSCICHLLLPRWPPRSVLSPVPNVCFSFMNFKSRHSNKRKIIFPTGNTLQSYYYYCYALLLVW